MECKADNLLNTPYNIPIAQPASTAKLMKDPHVASGLHWHEQQHKVMTDDG